jgi:6-phosphogluconolactonase
MSGSLGDSQAPVLLFAGSYTRDTQASGISAHSFDQVTGQLTHVFDNEGIDNPSYLCLHPILPVLYCVNEVNDYQGRRWGSVSAYRINQVTGQLTLLNQQSSMGANPCHLSTDPAGRLLFVSNYSGGSLVILALQASGEIGDFLSLIEHHGKSVDPVRQNQAHVHFATLPPGGSPTAVAAGSEGVADRQFVYVVDLGLDQVAWYPLALGTGAVHGNQRRVVRLKPGAGPRHLCFDRTETRAYLITELDSTLITLDRSPDTGELIEMTTHSLLPEGCEEPNYGAHIVLSEDGRFLYGSNRGHDSLVIFEVNADSGIPCLLGHEATAGSHPRHFSLSPNQAFLVVANKDSNQLVCFARNADTGMLTPAGIQVDTPSPTCILFMADRRG